MTKQFLSTRYTRTAIDIIREKVTKLANILNITVQIIFMIYYSFMIFSNKNSVTHIILYSVFLGTSIFVFILGFLFKNNNDDTQKDLKLKKEKKKKILNITHIIKYVARSIILIFSLYEVLSKPSTEMRIFLTIISGIFFICQILFEIVVKLINTYVDYIRLSVEKDIESSNLINIVKFFTNKNGNTVPFYTEKEENILNFLEIETEMRYPSKKTNQKSTNEPAVEEKTKSIEKVVGKGLFSIGKKVVNNLTKISTRSEEKGKTTIQNNNTKDKNLIKTENELDIDKNFVEDNYQEKNTNDNTYTNINLEIKKDKLNKYSIEDVVKPNKKQSTINKNIILMYEAKIIEATKIIEDFEKVVNVLYSANEKYLRISNTQNELSLIPDFIAIILSFIRKDYSEISNDSINKILGTLLYFVASNDVIPDAVPFIGYNDDMVVIKLCLKDTKNDFINYYDWKNQIEVESLSS